MGEARPMLESETTQPCWTTVGVWGRDEPRCPELPRVVHCRNCPVFASAGRALLDREPPVDYAASWIEDMAVALSLERQKTEPVLIFRLGEEMLGLPLSATGEVVTWRPIRSIPHRRDDLLLGIANLDGALHVCVSLEVLFGGERPDVLAERPRGRLVVIGNASDEWVIPVDEAYATHRAAEREIQAPPVTVSRSSQPFLRGVLPWHDQRVGLLDPALVLGAVRRRLA